MGEFRLKKNTLTRHEANDFVNSVVNSAFEIEDDGNINYSPLSQITSIKLNICKFYGDVTDDELNNIDELYEKCCDIDIDELSDMIVDVKDGNSYVRKQFNYVQLQDIIKASEMKIEYMKERINNTNSAIYGANDRLINTMTDIMQQIDTKVLPLEEALRDITTLANGLEKITKDIDVDMLNKFADRFSSAEFEKITAKDLVEATLTSASFQEHQKELSERMKSDSDDELK